MLTWALDRHYTELFNIVCFVTQREFVVKFHIVLLLLGMERALVCWITLLIMITG